MSRAQIVYWTLYGLLFTSLLVYIYSYFVNEKYNSNVYLENFENAGDADITEDSEKSCKKYRHSKGDGRGHYENAFQKIWNGYYTYAQTVPNVNTPDNFLKIDMDNVDEGIVSIKDNHWLVKSYGNTVLSGNSRVDGSSINIEYVGDWRKCCETEPKIKVVVSGPTPGQMKSISTSNPTNLDGLSIKHLL